MPRLTDDELASIAMRAPVPKTRCDMLAYLGIGVVALFGLAVCLYLKG